MFPANCVAQRSLVGPVFLEQRGCGQQRGVVLVLPVADSTYMLLHAHYLMHNPQYFSKPSSVLNHHHNHSTTAMRVNTLKGAQRMVSACMAAPVRKAAAAAAPRSSSQAATAAAAANNCSLCCSSSSSQRLQHAALSAQVSSSSSRCRSSLQRLGVRALATAAVEARPGPAAPPKDQVLTQDPANNVSEYIYSKMGINLHHQPSHPIGIIKQVCVVHCHCTVQRCLWDSR